MTLELQNTIIHLAISSKEAGIVVEHSILTVNMMELSLRAHHIEMMSTIEHLEHK